MSKLIRVLKLLQFEISNFSSKVFDILDKFELVCQKLLNLAEICTICPLYQDIKSEHEFFDPDPSYHL